MYQLLCIDKELLELANNLATFTKSVAVIDNINYLDHTVSNDNKSYLTLDHSGLYINHHSFSPLNLCSMYNDIYKRCCHLSSETLISLIKIKINDKKVLLNFNNSDNIKADKTAKRTISILDLTAGFAKDSLLMANYRHELYNYSLTLIDNNALLITCIYYAILTHKVTKNAQISLVYSNNYDYILNAINNKQYFDIIYIDNMFTDNKQHKAKAKKSMQIIQQLSSEQDNNTDEVALLNYALLVAKYKIIVKRDNKQTIIAHKIQPSYSKINNTIRYDIYLISTLGEI